MEDGSLSYYHSAPLPSNLMCPPCKANLLDFRHHLISSSFHLTHTGSRNSACPALIGAHVGSPCCLLAFPQGHGQRLTVYPINQEIRTDVAWGLLDSGFDLLRNFTCPTLKGFLGARPKRCPHKHHDPPRFASSLKKRHH